MQLGRSRSFVVVLVAALAVACNGTGSAGLALAAVPRASADPAAAVFAGDAINDFGL